MLQNLTASLQAYSALMADGYEEKYKYYTEAIEATAPINYNKFYDNEYDDCVSCTWYHPKSTGSDNYVNTTDGCSPNNTPSYAIGSQEPTILYTDVFNMSGFLSVAENTYGIEQDWIDFDAYTLQQQYCETTAPVVSTSPPPPCSVGTVPPWYQPALYSSIDVADPAASISKSLANCQNISDWINDIVVDMSVGLYLGNDADVLDSVDIIVYTVDAAVDSMQQVYDIGSQVEDEIKEEERKNIILLFISAFLLLIPGLGEELDAIVDASIFARTGTMIGSIGDAATTLYSVYEDPDSAPLAIAGLLIGGLVSREDSVLADAAQLRRGMSADKIAGLGERTEGNLQKLAPLRARCDI